jgi:hypothetical protein
VELRIWQLRTAARVASHSYDFVKMAQILTILQCSKNLQGYKFTPATISFHFSSNGVRGSMPVIEVPKKSLAVI